MLLELPDTVIKQMLTDESVLSDGINRALEALSPNRYCNTHIVSAHTQVLHKQGWRHTVGYTHTDLVSQAGGV